MPEKRTIFILPVLVHFYAVADTMGKNIPSLPTEGPWGGVWQLVTRQKTSQWPDSIGLFRFCERFYIVRDNSSVEINIPRLP